VHDEFSGIDAGGVSGRELTPRCDHPGRGLKCRPTLPSRGARSGESVLIVTVRGLDRVGDGQGRFAAPHRGNPEANPEEMCPQLRDGEFRTRSRGGGGGG